MDREANEGRYMKLRASTVAINDFFNRVGPRFYAWYFTLIGYRSSLKYFLKRFW